MTFTKKVIFIDKIYIICLKSFKYIKIFFIVGAEFKYNIVLYFTKTKIIFYFTSI